MPDRIRLRPLRVDDAASNTVARRCGMRPSDEVVDGEVRWTDSVRHG